MTQPAREQGFWGARPPSATPRASAARPPSHLRVRGRLRRCIAPTSESLKRVSDPSVVDRVSARETPSLYRDAQDLAPVSNLSLNELLLDGVASHVRSQLEKSVTSAAIERRRAARQVGEPAGGPRSRVRGAGSKATKSRRST